ncbi:MAG: glycosyltransferase involved in cell wall biosynthesis [Gammaproteobacteria bacterium]|jgi:glycosyltransferase involved in cell wall biosynthesis
MHILYFHQHFSTPSGATGTRSYEMAKKLLLLGHSVIMVCGSYNVGATGLSTKFINGRREGDVEGIQVIEFDLSYSNTDGFAMRSWQFVKFAYQSVKIALKQDYDLLFATSTPLTASIPGIFAKTFRKKKFVFEVRDLWPELPKAMGVITNPVILWGMSVLEKLSYTQADACIGLSPGIVEGIKGRSRKNLPVALIPNGCDISLFENKNTTFKMPFELNEGQVVACFTGAHGLANGLDNILDAAQELKNRGDDKVVILFVGEGGVKASLIERAKQQQLDNCIFLNAMPKHQLVDLLNAADIGLMPLANVPAFYYGTSPNKFFDYISCGLPVLNNYPGWLADMINEYACGTAVTPDNPVALADALLDMASNKEALLEMGFKGKQLAKDKFNREDLSDQFAQFLIEVANK